MPLYSPNKHFIGNQVFSKRFSISSKLFFLVSAEKGRINGREVEKRIKEEGKGEECRARKERERDEIRREREAGGRKKKEQDRVDAGQITRRLQQREFFESAFTDLKFNNYRQLLHSRFSDRNVLPGKVKNRNMNPSAATAQ